MRRDLAIGCLLTILTLTAFGQAPRCGFVAFDDATYVYNNPYVRQGLSWPAVGWAFTTGETGNWHPLTWLSLMLDVACFGVDSAAHHRVNLGLHVVNTLLLFWFLRQATGQPWPSAVVAALFAVHPLHVESVAWVSERKDVLSTSFGFLALLAYAVYVRRPSVARYLPVFFLLALALLAKPMWVTLPFMLLLLDVWPLGAGEGEGGRKGEREKGGWVEEGRGRKGEGEKGRGGEGERGRKVEGEKGRGGGGRKKLARAATRKTQQPAIAAPRATCGAGVSPADAAGMARPQKQLVLEKLPLLALSAASCIVTYMVQRQAGAMLSGTGLSLGVRVANSLLGYATYLLKTLWPSNLAVLYPLTLHPDPVRVVAAAALLAAVSAGVWAARRRPYLFVGWCWYLGTLLPVIGLIQIGNQAMADRYTYVPLIGVFIMVAWGAADVLSWLCPSPGTRGENAALTPCPSPGGRGERWAAVGLAAGVLGLLTWRTAEQVGFWIDSQSLLAHALEATTDNALVQATLGGVLNERAQTRPEAIQHFREALRILPQLSDVRYEFAVALADEGRMDEAGQQYRELLRYRPDDSRVHNGLGMCLATGGAKEAAIDQFRAAVKLDPSNADAYNNLGLTLAETGRVQPAIETLGMALKLNPSLAMTRFNLARVLAAAGLTKEAAAEFRRAAALAAAQGQSELTKASLARLEALEASRP